MSSFEHGLSATIRSSVSSEQFDLTNFTEIKTKDLISSSFSRPLDAPTEMIKFTFVVGGGKLVRSRYHDDLPKWMTNSLREIGYVEDRSAALDFSSQGTFKHQHDTGQNLKVIIVFPRLTCGESKEGVSSSISTEPTLDTNSKEYIVCSAELETFKEIVNHKVESWTLKKRLLKILQDSKTLCDSLEQKLVQGIQLSNYEQSIYDSNPGCANEKINWLQDEIKLMVDSGRLTNFEKSQLLETINSNLTTLEEELTQARSEGKEKKVEKIEEKKQNVLTRKRAVENISPIIHRLKYSNDIHILVGKLQPLYALEEKGRSMSLTLADLKALEEKHEFEERIIEYENASRCWFETDEEFSIRCTREKEEGKSKYLASKKKSTPVLSTKPKSATVGTQGKMSTQSNSNNNNNNAALWNTIGKKKPVGSQQSGKKKSSSNNGFAAAFGGDSDEDS